MRWRFQEPEVRVWKLIECPSRARESQLHHICRSDKVCPAEILSLSGHRVTMTSSDREIKKAFHALSRIAHPDKNVNHMELATTAMQIVNGARDALMIERGGMDAASMARFRNMRKRLRIEDRKSVYAPFPFL